MKNEAILALLEQAAAERAFAAHRAMVRAKSALFKDGIAVLPKAEQMAKRAAIVFEHEHRRHNRILAALGVLQHEIDH
jgi:hypothetical protein